MKYTTKVVPVVSPDCEYCDGTHLTDDEYDECEDNYWDWYADHQYDDVDFSEGWEWTNGEE